MSVKLFLRLRLILFLLEEMLNNSIMMLVYGVCSLKPILAELYFCEKNFSCTLTFTLFAVKN